MRRSAVILFRLTAQAGGAAKIVAETVCVASIHCPSVRGKTEENVRNITDLVRQAAVRGAKVVVLPECAVQSSLDPVTGWYGPNEADWFGKEFPQKVVLPYRFDVIAAKWASQTRDREWPGRGHSCLIARQGKVFAMSDVVFENDIVVSNLEIRERPNQAVVGARH